MMTHRLVILYGIGGLSDVGRHAVQVAVERSDVEWVRVITQYPEKIKETNWECGCPGGHHLSGEGYEMIPVKDWKTTDMKKHLEGATAVISALGNRQPGWADKMIKTGWNSHEGNSALIEGMTANNVDRAVVISSVGVEEDWPPMEFHWAGKILGILFKTNTKKAFKDLTQMERTYRKSSINFLFVRPVGIGEECVPVGNWCLQKEKGKDALFLNMAKLDVARYMIEEAIAPTRHKSAVVIGAELPTKSS